MSAPARRSEPSAPRESTASDDPRALTPNHHTGEIEILPHRGPQRALRTPVRTSTTGPSPTAPATGKAFTVRLRLVATPPSDPEGAHLPIQAEAFITTEELARLLRVDPSTVRRWRTVQPIQGPPFIQLSERVTMYNVEDVQQWLAARRVIPEAA